MKTIYSIINKIAQDDESFEFAISALLIILGFCMVFINETFGFTPFRTLVMCACWAIPAAGSYPEGF